MNTSKHHLYLYIAISFVTVAFSLFLLNKFMLRPSFISGLLVGGKEVAFTGIIQEIDGSCGFDGVCRVNVGGVWIITNTGGDPSPEMTRRPSGKILNGAHSPESTIGDPRDIGKLADVYGIVTKDNVTVSLYGSSKYFIKVK